MSIKKIGEDYNLVKESFQSCDLLLFSGNDPISKSIRKVEKKLTGYGEYSHAGIVIRGCDIPELDDDELYVFESTMSGPLGDGALNIKGESFLGVQMRNLDVVMREYDKYDDTKIAHCQLLPEKRAQLADDWKEVLTKSYHMYDGRSYEMTATGLVSAGFEVFRPLRALERYIAPKSKEHLFCSELVCCILQGDVLPVDFVSLDGESTLDKDKDTPVIFSIPRVITFYP
jgi:hypothetical protein